VRVEESDQMLFVDDGEGGYQRVDNVTDEVLASFRGALGDEISKDDIYFYVYGVLHSPDYKQRFAADLTKVLPRIPRPATLVDFAAFVSAGRQLSSLHLGYESVDPFPLEELHTSSGPVHYRVQKMTHPRIGKAPDKSTIVFNSTLTLGGIPPEVYEYRLGSRSALEWVMERYQVKTDKASGIVNDPNDWCDEVGDPRYIIDLVKRIVTVSVETVRIVNSLPPLEID
jgi:predicted helicase